MLRLSIVRNFNFLSKTLPAQLDQPIFVKNLGQTTNFNGLRHISLTTARLCDSNKEKENNNDDEDGGDEGEKKTGYDITQHWRYKKWLGTPRDRTKIIPVETSIEYIKSSAFKSTYGDKKVWELYRRVHKGQLPRKLTRRDCISHGMIGFGSPCPICRDEYLVVDYRNLELLKMFISPYTGEVNSYILILAICITVNFPIDFQILSFDKTGLCQRQHTKLLVHVERAYDLGLLEYQVPFREFDYADYYDVYKKPVFHPKGEHAHRNH